MILRDIDIAALAEQGKPIVTPFVATSVRKGVISYGLTHTGYDIRIANKFSLFRPVPLRFLPDKPDIIDPKEFRNENILADVCVPDSEALHMSPYQYALGVSVEYFRMPPDTVGIVVGKSTYARCGIIINVTPIEPGWEGYLTIEIFNATSRRTLIYPNEGICQVLFFRAEGPVGQSYAQKNGKYQAQMPLPIPALFEK